MDLRRRIATRVTDIRDRGQRLVQLNLELLASELKDKGKKFGAAVGLFIAAGLFSLYALGFLLATFAAVIAVWLPVWAALLIVTAALFLLVAVLVLVGRDRFRKIGDPKPEAAIAEAKATAEMMKSNARGTMSGVAQRLRPRRAAPTGSAAPEAAGVASATVSSSGPAAGWASAPPPPPSGPAQGSSQSERPAPPAAEDAPTGTTSDAGGQTIDPEKDA
jgi:hypothetical protein